MTEAGPPLRRPSLWLLATAAVTLAPHAARLPVWLSALCALLIVWHASRMWHGGPTPAGIVIMMIAVTAGLGVKADFGQFFGKDPGIAMLAVLLCLKLLETRATRDIRSGVLLSLFLQLGLFLFNQTPVIALAALLGTLLATTTLLCLHDERASATAQLRAATTLFAQGLPFMLVLFVLFPRIQGPLWGLPADAYSAISGLSESMSPGSISELGLSDAIAFRAEFAGTPPPPAQRYWRGPVLTAFDGRVWRAVAASTLPGPTYPPAGRRYDYRLTLEPHNQRGLLGLDFPAGDLPRTRYASDFQLLADAPVRVRTRFDLSAYPEARVGLDEAQAVLSAALRLPAKVNPRSRALAGQLASGASSAGIVLDRVLDHLRASALVYTLRPPLLGTDTVDAFLFDSRRGFCEHFSSAFVFLMRAAGVPARVVTGYQGGEINPVDGSVVVRQSDAHAWAEVWLAGRGWTRVDPTALAAPLRIEAGLAAALPQGEPLPFMMRPALSWLRDLRHHWDAVSNTWNQWILGYNPERQRELLTRLGFPRTDWRTLAVLLGVTTCSLMLLLFGWAVIVRKRRDPIDRTWDAFCRSMARRGAPRLPWEGPIDYGRRVAGAFPADADALRDIAASYARLRYGPSAEPGAIRELARRIRRLKLK